MSDLTPSSARSNSAALPPFRIGEGFDIHALVPGRPLILGGVTVPSPLGLLGHSDADALCHAITDALLGAAALGDIGQHFPDTDPRYQGADSRVLLRATQAMVADAGWQLVNLDCSVIAQAPKLAPYIGAMRDNLAADLQVDRSSVNVKAKTAERLGALGRKEGIAVQAVVLLMRRGLFQA